MNKTDLINAIANKAELNKTQAKDALESIMFSIIDAMQNGEDVQLIGFGTFSVKTRAATTSRNPRTGESIDVPEKKVPVFKAGKGLKDAVEKK